MHGDIQGHRERVQQIAHKIQEARERDEKPVIYHGSSHSVRPDAFQDDDKIHVEQLDHVISIDPDEEKAFIEPDVTVRELTGYALDHGLMPYVVPEFPTISIGGAIQGGAGESSSFEHGLVGNHASRIEIVTGGAEIVEASEDRHSDLYYGTACSYGSLGIMTGITINLMPAKENVRLRYIRVDGFEDAIRTIKDWCERDIDFIDGIMFSRNRGVIMVGWLSDRQDRTVRRFGRMQDEWFYLHADRVSEHREIYEESIPLEDYLFRYNIGAFWAIKLGYREAGIPFNRYTRTLLHPFMDTATAYDQGIHGGNFSSTHIVQDIITANRDTLELLEWVDDTLGIYPLWLLPLQPQGSAKLAPNYLDTNLCINVGLWGRPDGNPVRRKHQLEAKARELEARKTLYAQQFYDRDTFWSIYDRDWYQRLRERYDADVFPTVYDKTHMDELPPPSMEKAARETFKKWLPGT
ncbi:MAG: FAD-binding protein [Candidatus Nanohaloarchaea archaeon]|nr:FAD-binding protein [Candidatus Nanohaloarchaea archaeon]